MKSLKSILAAAAVATVAMSGAANAIIPAPATTGTAGGIRVFTFTPTNINAGTHEDTNFQAGDTISATSTTNVDLEPYFYVKGSFGGNWVANGWDATESAQQTSVLEIFHNDTFNTNFSGFGNPTNGAHEVNMTIQLDYDSPATGPFNVFPKAPAADLNSKSDNAQQHETGGYLQFLFKQTMSAPSNVPAGNYSITPTITFTSVAAP